jgi:putative DNA-invertase from lambdoid prophage Rac
VVQGGTCYVSGVKCAIYHRVSTAEQDQKAAVADLKKAAKRRGLTVVAVVTETGSGGRADRPGWQSILSQARSLDVVLVWALDRAGRSTLDLLSQIDHLRKAGCGLVAVSQGLEISPTGGHTTDLTLTVLAAVAQFERGMLRERTRMGLARARARGKRLGRPPVLTPSRRKVAALRKEGASWPTVAKRLRCSVWAARKAAASLEG